MGACVVLSKSGSCVVPSKSGSCAVLPKSGSCVVLSKTIKVKRQFLYVCLEQVGSNLS